MEKGKYLLFLRAEGHLFAPWATNFKINGNKILWYKKPFLPGDYGPEFGEIPLSNAIQDIQQLIEKYKKGGAASGAATHDK